MKGIGPIICKFSLSFLLECVVCFDQGIYLFLDLTINNEHKKIDYERIFLPQPIKVTTPCQHVNTRCFTLRVDRKQKYSHVLQKLKANT